jgi:hypothetical protein
VSNLSVNTITDASGGSTASINGLTPQASNMQPFNRIINGDMRIDQRNAGAAVTYSSGTPAYLLDRWYGQGVTSAGVFTLQQSTDVPAGFNNSLKATVTTASTPSGTQVYRLIQRIEGFNTADLNLGTANAKTLTMSFWVKSSVTGTFGGSFWGGSATAWFPFSYTINSANTWEYKTVSIGAASSTPATAFNTTTGIGLQLTFNLGAASATLTTPSSWIYGATEYYGPTGQTNLIETNGATFYITGVQLEAGSSGSSFAHENYGDTLQKCQRYCEVLTAGAYGAYANGWFEGTTTFKALYNYKAVKRVAPTASASGSFSADGASSNPALSSLSIGSQVNVVVLQWVCTGATTGQGGNLINLNDATAKITLDAEL